MGFEDTQYKTALPYANALSRYLLLSQNISITRKNNNKDEKLFTASLNEFPKSWDKPHYKYPYLEVGAFEKSNIQKQVRDVATLTSMGYGIFRGKTWKMPGFKKVGQVTTYVLRKLDKMNPEDISKGKIKPLSDIPKYHKIFYDPIYKTLRIYGDHSDGTAIHLDGPKNSPGRPVTETISFEKMFDRVNKEDQNDDNET